MPVRALGGILAAGFVLAVAGGGLAAPGPPPCAFTAPAKLINRNPQATSSLVPPGASSIVLCRYHGFNFGANSKRLEAATVLQLQRGIAGFTEDLQALSPMSRSAHCPLDNGTSILAIFRYPNMADDPVRIGLSGCKAVDNGHVVRTAATKAGERLVRRLMLILEPNLTARGCSDSQLRPSVQTQGENTTAWIGITLQNLGNPCLVSPGNRVSVAIVQDGKLAAVAGNPLTLSTSVRLERGGTRLMIADWSNWCGSRSGLSLVVHVGRARTRASFNALPTCLKSGSSRLVAVR